MWIAWENLVYLDAHAISSRLMTIIIITVTRQDFHSIFLTYPKPFNFWAIHKMVPQKSLTFYFQGVWRGEFYNLPFDLILRLYVWLTKSSLFSKSQSFAKVSWQFVGFSSSLLPFLFAVINGKPKGSMYGIFTYIWFIFMVNGG